ncbi:MAG: helix-hairpin-helix domain-containing protein [Intestinibacter sp.]|uniref:helix-hairpin-helix domain-containing protein n=1 Tax=Intestinibacter sp. TaxID=1965304 RepID=UPI003F145472
MAMITRRGLIWEILNSLWIIFSFLGLPFVAFLYIGNKTKTTKWKVTALVYFLIYAISIVLICVSSYDMSTIFALVWLLSLFIGLIHSFLVRKEYLIRRDYILNNGVEEQELEELRKHVKKQYKGKDYIESSGNDTHLDSTYHSQINYRDYDTVDVNKNDDELKEYYDESITKGNEEILDNSEYISYSKKNTDSSVNTDGIVNINNCSVNDLLQLPGVTREIADKAISLRTMLGGFNSVQEFMDMMHIDSAYTDQIREKATVKDRDMY